MVKRLSLLVLCVLLTGPALATESAVLVDPTRPDGGGVAAVAVGPVLQSTMVSAGRKLAIISGRVVGIGETVGRARVTDIRPYEVTLKQGNHETHLRLIPRLDTNMNTMRGSHEPTGH